MLFQITNHCTMGCSHCLMMSRPQHEHMKLEDIGKALEFIQEVKPAALLITGGEPTSHPYFLNILDECIKVMKDKERIVILSNGLFLEDEDLTSEILKRNISVQITNDKRFYPKRIKKVQHPNFKYEENILMIDKVGRAKINNMKSQRKSPSCFNLLSIIKSGTVSNLKEAISLIEERYFKFCSLAIEFNGNIRIGESIECLRIGNIHTDSIVSTFNNALKLNSQSCNNCGLMQKLNSIYKNAIDK